MSKDTDLAHLERLRELLRIESQRDGQTGMWSCDRVRDFERAHMDAARIALEQTK